MEHLYKALPRASVFNRHYIVNSIFNKVLRKSLYDELQNQQHLTCIDIGGGTSPYYPFIEKYSEVYINTDITPTPFTDILCLSDQIGIKDESIDIAICTQVLEHVNDPIKTVSEIRRVLKPGSIVFLTTHGTFPYHPAPHDYWRWTHEGLERLFKVFCGFQNVKVLPIGGTISCLFELISFYFSSILFQRKGLPRIVPIILVPLRYTIFPIINVTGLFLDRASSSLLGQSYYEKYPLIESYLVVAKK